MIFQKTKKEEKGYIAIISAIIILFLIVIVGIVLNFSTLFARFNVLDAEYKRQSNQLAEACFEFLLLKLAQNPSYSTNNEKITIEKGECTIVSLTKNISSCPDNSFYKVKIQGKYPTDIGQTSFTNIIACLDYELNILSWKEVAKI